MDPSRSGMASAECGAVARDGGARSTANGARVCAGPCAMSMACPGRWTKLLSTIEAYFSALYDCHCFSEFGLDLLTAESPSRLSWSCLPSGGGSGRGGGGSVAGGTGRILAQLS